MSWFTLNVPCIKFGVGMDTKCYMASLVLVSISPMQPLICLKSESKYIYLENGLPYRKQHKLLISLRSTHYI
jgi:hypothetical protein